MNSSSEPAPEEPPAQASAQPLRALAERYRATLERERTRLAQELHDNLTQKLTVISLELSLLDGTLAADQEPPRGKVRGKLKELGGIVADMIQSLRKIKTQLRPKVLDEFGLQAALECESVEFGKRTGLQVRFRGEPEEIELDERAGTEVFRMAQEVLANIAQHAAAQRVEIEMAEQEGCLIIRIADDGRGIRPEEVDSPASLGLLELRERARGIGGQLIIRGGKGTEVTLRLPLNSPESLARAVVGSGI